MTSLTFYIIVFLSLATRSIDGNQELPLSSSDLLVDGYKNFINTIRERLTKNTSKLYDIPILKNSLPPTEPFITINLKNANNETIVLAIDVVNLGVVGYRSNNTSYVFFNAPPEASEIVFPSTCRVLLRFDSDYESIEKASGISRLQTLLGTDPLNSAISNLFHYHQESLPQSFLVILQMVLEGVKFKFIEQSVIKSLKYGYNFKPSLAMISLQDNWAKLSLQIQASTSLQGLFGEAINFYDSNNRIIQVDSIYYPIIITNIALQLYQCNVSTNFIRMPSITSDSPCYIQTQTSSISGREGFCIDATRGIQYDGNPIISSPCEHQSNEKWSFQRDGTIRYSNKCLTFDTSRFVVLYNCSKVEAKSTKWNVAIDGTISNPSSGLVLTANSSTSNTQLIVEANKYTIGQGWRVGNYVEPIIGSIIGLEQMCLEATNNNTNMWLENCVLNKAEQYWAVYSDGSIRVNSERNLCVTSSSDRSSALIVIDECNGTANQRWNFKADGTIFNLKTKLVVDVERAMVSLKRIILFRKTGNPNQDWGLFY
ncbi:seed lectin-like [Benincasa hispida]|uniref:seed lectin-like n=1 Tax=Benincasa hispida TaxID=102211 RepID=UPI0019005284|nr:seed lectin-like [Benincasa hispida]